MKKYTYLVNFDSQALERVGESFTVKGDGGIAELEFIIPSDFGIPPTQAVWRAYYKLPGERESLFETLPTVEQTESGDYVTGWVVTKALTQTSGRLGFSLAAISGNNIQWNSRTAIIPVYESRYQPESEEAEEPYTGRLAILEGDMAAIRGEFDDVVDDFEELKETATLGTPIPESLVANMQEGHVYIYTGTEPGYTAGHVYYYVDGVLKDGGQYGGIAIDDTLTSPTMAAPASEVGQIKEDLSTKTGLSEEAKQALLACFAKVAWVDEHGQDYYDALKDALYPPVNLARISAVYMQSGTVYTTDSLDSLKSDLVVTAHYSDSTSGVVTHYVLSGILAAGTSTITVSYGGKTTTFDVTVTDAPALPLYNWDFTQSLIDSVSGITARTNGQRDSSGLIFNSYQTYLELSSVFGRNRTYEIDVNSIVRDVPASYGRLFMVDVDTDTAKGGSGYILTGTQRGGDFFYNNGAWETNIIVPSSEDVDGSYYNNSTVGFYVNNDGYVSVYKNGVLLGTSQTAMSTDRNGQNVYIGSSSADHLENSIFTGFRIYEGNIYG